MQAQTTQSASGFFQRDDTRMKLPTTSLRAVAIITIVVSVIGLIMSPVSAATAFSLSGDPAGTPAGNTAYHHTFNSTQQAARLQTVLTNLSQQGVDTSPAQADLAAGNVTAAFQWLMTYHTDHPDLAMNSPRQHASNATAQAAHLQTVLTNLSQQGVDVSQATANLAAGNISGAMQDLMALHKDHPGTMANSTQLATRLRSGVTKLSQQGVDVSAVQADLPDRQRECGDAMDGRVPYGTSRPERRRDDLARRKQHPVAEGRLVPAAPRGFRQPDCIASRVPWIREPDA